MSRRINLRTTRARRERFTNSTPIRRRRPRRQNPIDDFIINDLPQEFQRTPIRRRNRTRRDVDYYERIRDEEERDEFENFFQDQIEEQLEEEIEQSNEEYFFPHNQQYIYIEDQLIISQQLDINEILVTLQSTERFGNLIQQHFIIYRLFQLLNPYDPNFTILFEELQQYILALVHLQIIGPLGIFGSNFRIQFGVHAQAYEDRFNLSRWTPFVSLENASTNLFTFLMNLFTLPLPINWDSASDSFKAFYLACRSNGGFRLSVKIGTYGNNAQNMIQVENNDDFINTYFESYDPYTEVDIGNMNPDDYEYFRNEELFGTSSSLSSNFKRGMKHFYIISHKTNENCIFTCIKQYLLFLQDKEGTLKLTNHQICLKGASFKKALKRNASNYDFDMNHIQRINEIIPYILQYLFKKKRKKFRIYIHSIKFSITKIYTAEGEGAIDHIIHLRAYDNHAQLLIPNKELTQECLEILSEEYERYQPIVQQITEDISVLHDPTKKQYYFDDKKFNNYSEFEEHCFLNNIDLFDEGTLKEVQYNNPPEKKELPWWQAPISNDFGVYDIESYATSSGTQVPFAIILVWKSKVSMKMAHKIFYGDVVCIQEFLEFIRTHEEEFKDITLYAHNQSNYDGFFIIKNTVTSDESELITKNILIVNNGFLKFVLKFNFLGKSFKVTWKDSIRILTSSLATLGKCFKVEHQKIENFKIEEHALKRHEEETKALILKYLEHDGLCLYEIIEVMEKFFKKQGLELHDVLTIPSAAVEIFIRKFWNQKEFPLPKVNQYYERILRESYLGGRTEAFVIGNFQTYPRLDVFDYDPLKLLPCEDTKEGVILMVDINSSYPKEMLEKLPFGKVKYVNALQMIEQGYVIDNKLTDKAFGFCFVHCKSTDALHGYKLPEKLIFPDFDVWTHLTLFSEEIKFAQSSLENTEYKFLGMIEFQGGYVLKDFIEHFWNERLEAQTQENKAQEYLDKLIMNSFYGFFALKQDRKCTKVYHKGKSLNYEEELETYWKNDKLCEIVEHGQYIFVEVLDKIESKLHGVYMSAAITSLARLSLYKIMHLLKKYNCDVYYCDTDSIIFKCPNVQEILLKGELYELYFKNNNELGKLKDEFTKLASDALKNKKILQEEFDQVCIDKIFTRIQWFSCGGCKMYQATSIFKKSNYRIDKSAIKGLKKNESAINFQDVFIPDTLDPITGKVAKRGGIYVDAQTEFRSKRPSIYKKKDDIDVEADYEDLGLTVNVSSVKKYFKENYKKGEKRKLDESDVLNYQIIPYKISSKKRKENEGAINEWTFLENHTTEDLFEEL